MSLDVRTSLLDAAGNFDQRFARLGVSNLEEYAEFIPAEAKPNPITGLFTNPIKKLYEGTPDVVGGSHSENCTRWARSSSSCASIR